MFASAVHFRGRFVSVLTPFRSGPRHCGQLSAFSEASDHTTSNSETNMRFISVQNSACGHHSQPRCDCTSRKQEKRERRNPKVCSSLLHSPVHLLVRSQC